MWELNHKEDWALKNWWFQTVVLGMTLQNPLDSKEIKPVNTKGNQPWPFIGRTDAEALILWLPNAKAWKRPWCWEKLRAGWQWGDRWLNGIINSVDMRLSKLHKIVKDREAWHVATHGVAKIWSWLSDWITVTNVWSTTIQHMKHWETPSPKSRICLIKLGYLIWRITYNHKKTIFSKNILYSVTNDHDILLTKVVK